MTIGRAGVPTENVGVAVTPGGAQFFTWRSMGLLIGDRERLIDQMAWRDAGGELVDSLDGEVVAPPVAVGRDRVAVLLERQVRGAPWRVGLRLATVVAGRGAGEGRLIAYHRPVRDAAGRLVRPAMAVGPRGDVAVAWIESARGRTRLRLAIRRAGRPLGRARTVARGTLGAVALAWRPRGELLIADARSGAVEVRLRRRNGRLTGRRLLGGVERPMGVDLHATATAIGWGSRPAGRCGVAKTVRVAARPADAAPLAFRPAVLLDAGVPGCESPTLALASDAADRSTIAWSAWAPGGARLVKVADADAAGTVGAPATVGTGDLGALVTAPDGRALVAWDDGADPTTFGEGPCRCGRPAHVLAALREPGAATFGPPEQVSDAADDAAPPVAAFDRGRPLVAWWGIGAGGEVAMRAASR